MKFFNKLGIQSTTCQTIQNILPLAELLDLPFQVLHQGIPTDVLPFLDCVKETIGAVEAVLAGFQGVLILIVGRLDILGQPVVDGFDLVGVLLLQVKALLIGLALDLLYVFDVLLLGFADLFL